jgi:hypothetical protein
MRNMIASELSLALSIHGNPGVYALLLGSGVSRSAGVPTGWEVVLDLIRKLAHLRGESCEPDEETWYRQRFAGEPNYSELLNDIAKSSSERMQLLRSYFEPTQEEREEGRKLPTPAHRSIAELVAKGYVRVIVTTNFDRLFEQALVDAGIQPVVISSGDTAQGALPLIHSRCTVVKVNGDYLDSRLRNTPEELASYDESVERLLDRIFDEYGLIVCGWSGEWDAGVRAAMERCPNRRFTTYWASRGKLNTRAQSLVTLRASTVVDIADADQFFRELLEKISALETMAVSDPVSAKVAVARMKKYLADDTQQISLRDLLTGETERVFTVLREDRFAPHGDVTLENILARMKAYEDELHLLLPLLACGAFWAKAIHDATIFDTFRRFADSQSPRNGTVVWLDLKRYPSLVLLYGMGLSAIANSNYRFLRKLLYGTIRADEQIGESAVASSIYCAAVLDPGIQKRLPGYERHYTALSNHLFDVLRKPLREYIPDDERYDASFDWFEYLFCLVHCDVVETRGSLQEKKTSDPHFHLRAPGGRFCWKGRHDDENGIIAQTKLQDGRDWSEKVAAVLHAEFFESRGKEVDKYREVKAGLDRFVAMIRREMW